MSGSVEQRFETDIHTYIHVRFSIPAPRQNMVHPLTEKLGDPYSWSSRQGGEEKLVTISGVESRSLSLWPITILTELLWIVYCCNNTTTIIGHSLYPGQVPRYLLNGLFF